jgi:hypothetical protein
MQIPHDADSAKYGMHLSKSTYQRSTPRTSCFCSLIAPGGHACVQTWQVLQNSSAPKQSGAVTTRGISVVTPARRTPDPKCRLINEPCLPSSPRPEAMAGGIRSRASAEGPGYAPALYPWDDRRQQASRVSATMMPEDWPATWLQRPEDVFGLDTARQIRLNSHVMSPAYSTLRTIARGSLPCRCCC